MTLKKPTSAQFLIEVTHAQQHWNFKEATRFFKTAPGSYGEHDMFIGVSVPQLRRIAQKYTCSLSDIALLLKNPFNEIRFLGLLLLIALKNESGMSQEIFDFYNRNRAGVNNWNLVDLSAAGIVGAWLWGQQDASFIETLSFSENLWDRRIAIVATHFFIKNGNIHLTFKVVENLLSDKEDLIHKACGWMLREAGKKDKDPLLAFLEQHADLMPATMWRYAIERLPEALLIKRNKGF